MARSALEDLDEGEALEEELELLLSTCSASSCVPVRTRGLSGWVSLLKAGLLSDITIQLPDGQEIKAHRAALASASDVLKAKFTTDCGDADEKIWRPDVGSAATWKWMVGWIYGCEDQDFSWDTFVEVLILADLFQISDLVQALKDIDVVGNANVLSLQLLSAFACPPVLDEIAARIVPAMSCSVFLGMVEQIREAPLQNATLLVKHLPMILDQSLFGEAIEEETFFEECRLTLLGALFRAQGRQDAFPECFVSAVSWECFAADTLEAAEAGNFARFEQAFGPPMPVPKLGFAKIAMARCHRLETAQKALRQTMQATTGLYFAMMKKGIRVQVECFPARGGVPYSSTILALQRMTRFTGDEAQSWIELKSENMLVHPRAIGLLHGTMTDTYRCQHFVVEARLAGGDWTELLSFNDRPLSDSPELFHLDKSKFQPDGRRVHFDCFRIRMTGRNTSSSWNLAVAWFDVFGSMQPKVVPELLLALTRKTGEPSVADREADEEAQCKRRRTE